MRNVLCNTPTPTFKQLSDGVLITPETPQELPGQYYSFANTMVEYLYLQFGKDAYAKLLLAYKDGVNADVNFPKVLGVTPTQFYDGWVASSKKKYCLVQNKPPNACLMTCAASSLADSGVWPR